MLFNSFPFLIFFVVVTVLYYMVSNRWRWLLLLLASCYFYMSFIPAYILVLFSIIIVDYTAAICMEKMKSRKKLFLALSITANITILVVFKYYNFFIENVNGLLGAINIKASTLPYWHIILPIGLSFHTFQAMSYTIEVYRGNYKAERHFGIYSLYVMFYPQLVAGPIERPAQLLPQFHKKDNIDYAGIIAGLKIMLWGFFLKLVLADRVAIFVDYVFVRAEWHSRSALILAAFFYPFQVYGDFAGYSLIAIGAAKTMGITLSENFRRPFLSPSLAAFWTRWHITLYSWFRDYVYIPLGGNRRGLPRQVFNILLVFLLSGLWHGPQWNFVVFGGLQGLIVIMEILFVKKPIVSRVGGILYTFIAFSLCLIIFRAHNLQQGLDYIKRLFNPQTPWFIIGEFEERALLLYSFFAIGTVMAADIIREFFGKRHLLLYSTKPWARLMACIVLILIILLTGVFDSAQFIYFQF